MAFFRRLNTRAITWDKIFGTDEVPWRTHSGKSVTEETALKYSVVWLCVNLIADSIATLPPEARRETPDGRHEVETLPQWIRRPHPSISREVIWGMLLLSVLLWGNGYALLMRRPSDNAVIGMEVLDPAQVQCEWDKNRPGFRMYKINGGPTLNEFDILHLQGPTLPGQPVGLSVIGSAKEAIGLGLTIEEFGARYFKQGSLMRGVIESSSSKFDRETAEYMVRTFERHHKGPDNWHRPAFLSNATWKSITIPNQEAQFLESRTYQVLDVARWFRVPPHRVGIVTNDSSRGSGLSAENTFFLEHTLRSWIRRFESLLTAYSPGGFDSGLIIRLKDDDFLRGTFSEMVTTWSTAYEKGIAMRNEARAKLGLQPVDGGDVFFETPGAKSTDTDGNRQPEDETEEDQPPEAGDDRSHPFRNAERREWTLVKSPHACSACSANQDPKAVPVHPSCGCSAYWVGPDGQREDGFNSDDDGFKVDSRIRDEAHAAKIDEFLAKKGLTLDGLVDEIVKLGKSQLEAGAAWYPEAHQTARAMARKYDISVRQAVAIISETSPQTDWARNLKITDGILKNFRGFEGVDSMTIAKQLHLGLNTFVSAGIDIARNEMLNGRHSVFSIVTGRKRQSFVNNMLMPGRTSDVTVDTWMARSMINASGGTITLKEAKSMIGAKHGYYYTAISEATRKAAAQLGVPADTMQAAYWIAVRGSAL